MRCLKVGESYSVLQFSTLWYYYTKGANFILYGGRKIYNIK